MAMNFPLMGYPKEPIAIVGSACRFPGEASSPSKLWALLSRPRDVLRKIPTSRFNVDKFYHPSQSHHGTTTVRDSYTLSEDHEVFDAQFFGVKALEASSIDPQQRILLETAYEALEAAGVPMEDIQGTDMGVFVGLMNDDHASAVSRDVQTMPTYFASGTSRSIVSNRLSYFFDLHGPSMTIDTACSSSLVALHQAVSSLRNGDCSTGALVAGANLLLGPEPYIASSKLGMLSPSSRSRMWDAGADGYARGEGFAVLVVKTLSRAIADGDAIECLIRETGVNQDGRTRGGITMPNPQAQAQLIKETYAKAGLDLSRENDRPQFFEAHGTGTPAGDPVEGEAIATAFFGPQNSPSCSGSVAGHDERPPLSVGSIKTVIGHTEASAGLAGVMKVSLALQNAAIPPNLLFDELNPRLVPFCRHLRVPTGDLTPWPSVIPQGPRRASVNSFGFGGTNAHAILESFDCESWGMQTEIPTRSFTGKWKQQTTSGREEDAQVVSLFPFVFSAASEATLRTVVKNYLSYIRKHQVEASGMGNHEAVFLRDLSWTLYARRSVLPVRVQVSALTIKELCYQLEQIVHSQDGLLGKDPFLSALHSPAKGTQRHPVRAITRQTFKCLGIFTGQGAQWPAMGSQLLREIPAAKKILRTLQESLDSLPHGDAPNWRLLDALLETNTQSSRIHQAEFSQPLCTAVQIILVDMLRAANIQLSAVVGHSSGEIAAAYAAGYLSAHGAIRVSYYRGLCFSLADGTCISPPDITDKPQGAMVAIKVPGGLQDAKELCELTAFKGRITIAAHNSPTSLTLSGDADAMQDILEIMEDEGKPAKLLKVDRAYHSHHMHHYVAAYIDALHACQIQIKERNCNGGQHSHYPVWISSVTGRPIEDLVDFNDALKSTYWGDNMVQPVLFSQAIEHAMTDGLQSQLESFDAILEVGPHPALKRPVLETIQSVLEPVTGDDNDDTKLPRYIATLNRGTEDVLSISLALGSLWELLGSQAFDFVGLDEMAGAGSGRKLQVLKNLPTYPWDHSRKYRHKSRYADAFYRGGPASIESQPRRLLGSRCYHEETSPDNFRFRNRLSPVTNVPWVTDHRIHGQIIFPAAGYVSAAVEALLVALADTNHLEAADLGVKRVRIIEMLDLVFIKALSLPEDSDGETAVEILVEIKIAERRSDSIVAEFSVYSEGSKNASARLHAFFEPRDGPPRGQQDDSFALPLASPPLPEILVPVSTDRFYSALRDLGYGYDGEFRGLCDTKRRTGEALGHIVIPNASRHDGENLTLRPATLDCALQAVLLAHSYPGDGEIRSLHLPTGIDRICLDLSAMPESRHLGDHDSLQDAKLAFQAYVTEDDDSPGTSDTTTGATNIIGHVQVYKPESQQTVIDLQGLRISPLETSDVTVFYKMVWGPEGLTSSAVDASSLDFGDMGMRSNYEADPRNLYLAIERACHFYMRKVQAAFPLNQTNSGLLWYHRHFLGWIDATLARLESGGHTYLHKDTAEQWHTNDTEDVIKKDVFDRFPNSIDLQLIRAVGEDLPRAMRGEINLLETMMAPVADNGDTCEDTALLTEFYKNSLGMKAYLAEMGRVASQLSHRLAHLDMIEIGAGVGAATVWILDGVSGGSASTFADAGTRSGSGLHSYTYTDISSAFFDKAKAKFASHRWRDRIDFRTLDIEKSPVSQGFETESYDVVVASLVLHATTDLRQTLVHTRQLLRPGGYLIMLEITDNDPLRLGFIFGGLPGWWLGARGSGSHGTSSAVFCNLNSNRDLSPCVSIDAWRQLLLESGFSQVDALTPHCTDPELPLPLSMMVCQAVDDRIRLLREPLSSGIEQVPGLGHLTIVDLKEPCQTTSNSRIARPYVSSAAVAEVLSQHPALSGYYCNGVQYVTLSLRDDDDRNRIIPILPPGGTIVSLIDFGPYVSSSSSSGALEFQPTKFLQDAQRRLLQFLQAIYRQSKTIVWVTSNGSAPMFKGMSRSIALEMPHVQVQNINFDFGSNSDMPAPPPSPSQQQLEEVSELVARKLIQLEILSSPYAASEEASEEMNRYEAGRISLGWKDQVRVPRFFKKEPDLSVRYSSKGQLQVFVPRLLPANDRNNRYNSARRRISQQVQLSAKNESQGPVIRLVPSGSSRTSLSLIWTSNLKAGVGHYRSVSGGERVEIALTRSILYPIQITDGCMGFLSTGITISSTGSVGPTKAEKVLLISPSLASRMTTADALGSCNIPVPTASLGTQHLSDDRILLDLQVYIIGRRILELTRRNGDRVIVLFNAGNGLAHAVGSLCAHDYDDYSRPVLVLIQTCTGSKARSPLGEPTTSGVCSHMEKVRRHYIHPRAGKREWSNILASLRSYHGSFTFVDLSLHHEEARAYHDLIGFYLEVPRSVHQIDASQLFGMPSGQVMPNLEINSNPESVAGGVHEVFSQWRNSRCFLSAERGCDHRDDEPPRVTLAEMGLAQQGSSRARGDEAMTNHLRQLQSILSWDLHEQDTITVPLQPASKLVTFSPNKTYWLVGLTGGLGISLCEWMADRGARYIVLSSRTPNVPNSWVRHIASSRSCTVRVVASDVTDRQSLHTVKRQVGTDWGMPPIAGVVQGAMVLHDALFLDLDDGKWAQVLQPKVQGTVYLDELFSARKQDGGLDFFILLSSLAYIVGNPGQSAYTAANALMAALAANRHKRGLAASVVNLAGIKGEGYVARRLTIEKELSLQKGGFPFIPMRAFLEAFAEAILASPVEGAECIPDDSGPDSFEITTMFRAQDSGPLPGQVDGKTFAANPMFQHLIPDSHGTGHLAVSGGRGASISRTSANPQSIKRRLEDSENEEQTYHILYDGLVDKLKLAFQTDSLGTGTTALPTLEKLGIDSLMAVDIQAWFRREVNIEVPTLRILNAQSIEEVVKFAQSLQVEKEQRRATGSEHRIESPTLAPSTGPSANTVGEDLSSENKTTQQHKGELGVVSLTRDTPSIRSLDLERTLPMSFAQSRIWFLKRLYTSNHSAFNVTTVCRLKGRIDPSMLARALQAVGQQNENLRTVFYTDPLSKRPMQGVSPSFSARLQVSTITGEEELPEVINNLKSHVFDLEKGESLGLHLFSFSQDANLHALVLCYHHIVMDGISHQLFYEQLERAYQGGAHALLQNSESIQCPDVSLREASEHSDGSWDAPLTYWREQFRTPLKPLPLLSLARPTARRPEIPSLGSFTASTRVSLALRRRMEEVCRSEQQNHNGCPGVTPFHLYLAVFHILLSRYTATDAEDVESSPDICIGIADSGRKDADVLRSLGLFLNLLPLRLRRGDSSPQNTFTSVFRHVKSTADLALANSRVPFDAILSEVGGSGLNNTSSKVGGGGGSPHTMNPLFQAFFNYRPNVREKFSFCNCEARGTMVSGGEDAYDVSMDVSHIVGDVDGAGDLVTIAVNKAIYTEDDAGVLMSSFMSLLEAALQEPDYVVLKLSLHRVEHLGAGIDAGRGPQLLPQWPAIHTIIDRIDANAESFGHRAAVSDGHGRNLSYRHMLLRVGELTEKLQQRTQQMARNGTQLRVGLFQRPGVDWICSFLAILRAGAACVPLDPHTGLERLNLMVQDCKPAVILLDVETWSKGRNGDYRFLINTKADLMCVDNDDNHGSYKDSTHGNVITPSQATLFDTAVITYTSGSTGTPKGIQLQHFSVRNFVEAGISRWGLKQGQEVILQQSSYAFDMSICQIVLCLCSGGTLVVPSTAQRQDPAALYSLMASQGVTFTIATPTEYFGWIRYFTRRHVFLETKDRVERSQTETLLPSWKKAMSGGEPVTAALLWEFKELLREQSDFTLINAYGPAETTFACADAIVSLSQLFTDHGKTTGYEDDDDNDLGMSSLSSLSPLPNYSICIVDDDMNPVPIGVPGQILIGGAGVGSGSYLNQDSEQILDDAAFLTPSTMSNTLRGGTDSSTRWVHGRGGTDSWHLSGDRGRIVASSSSQSENCQSSAGPGPHLRLEGRIKASTQVKIRGMRIELAEIEQAILKVASHDVQEVVVSCREANAPGASSLPPNNKFLLAFVCLSSSITAKGEKATRDFLEQLPARLPLPRHMRPALVIQIDRVPKTPSNKVDRLAIDALPLPVAEDVVPNTTMNSKIPSHEGDSVFMDLLRSLWEEVLPSEVLSQTHPSAPSPLLDDQLNGRRMIAKDDDFFHLGGSSLTLITLQALILERANISVTLESLFRASTFGEMAMLLKREASTKRNSTDSTRTSNEQTGLEALGKVVASETTGVIEPLSFWEQETDPRSVIPEGVLSLKSAGGGNFTTLRRSNGPGLREGEESTSTPDPCLEQRRMVHIILTGATGYLGRHVIRKLIDHPAITQIYCIAVRSPKDALHGNGHAIFANPKVTMLAGDLTAPNLGLDEEQARLIFSGGRILPVDHPESTPADPHEAQWERHRHSDRKRPTTAIIHLGAEVSFLKSYKTLREANVGSTKELMRLVCLYSDDPARTAFHFISTAAVAQLSGLDEFGPTSVARYPPPPPVLFPGENGVKHAASDKGRGCTVSEQVDGYIASKWASEVFLERVCLELFGSESLLQPPPVIIHRPSTIFSKTTLPLFGDGSQDEIVGAAGERDLMTSVLKFAYLTRTVPHFASIPSPHSGFNPGSESDPKTIGSGGGDVGIIGDSSTILERADVFHTSRSGGWIDLVSVDKTAETIVDEVIGSSSVAPITPALEDYYIKYVYESGEIQVPIWQLAEVMADMEIRAAGGVSIAHYSHLPLAEWINYVAAAGMDPLLAEYLRRRVIPRIGLKGVSALFPKLVKA